VASCAFNSLSRRFFHILPLLFLFDPRAADVLPPPVNFSQYDKSNIDVLGNLSEEDQERVLEWLENTSYREVLKLIAEPAPEGFGLKIHYNSLRKFYLKNLPLRLNIHRHDEAIEWQALTKQAEIQPIDENPARP